VLRLVNLVTAGGLINFIVMSITYIFFYKACQAQGLDRRTLPYRGWFQPYSAYISSSFLILVVFTYGYSVFRKGGWDVGSFFTYYTMLILAPINFLGWKLIKKTKLIKAAECDLIWDLPAIELHEEECASDPAFFSIRKSFKKTILRRG
jgi:amino acid transporter|tara:strand:+ start:631 stop:1077 length:447 start_codon:yes stop_codon:yes gene_type:complete